MNGAPHFIVSPISFVPFSFPLLLLFNLQFMTHTDTETDQETERQCGSCLFPSSSCGVLRGSNAKLLAIPSF